jgi:hemolysin activation/secretion protein
VIANRIGGGTTVGSPAFFQNIQLGGVNSLRGFNSRRFTGRTGAYHNLDLRLKLFNFTSYLVPGTVGMIGFNDVGRVWQPGESSGRWHHGYGGGLYIMPGDQILIQGTIGISKEATMPYFSVGFNF